MFKKSQMITMQNRTIRIMLVMAIFVLSIAAILYGIQLYQECRATSEITKMKDYLETKYGRKFVVGNYRIEGSGLGVEGGGVADAHRQDSSYKFLVLEKKPSYRDNYLNALYDEQEASSIVDLAERIGLDNTKYSVDISINADLADYIKGTPSLSEMLSKYGDKIVYGISVIKNGNIPKKEDVDKLKLLIEHVKAKNSRRYAVRYVINSETEDSRYLCRCYGGTSEKTSLEPSIECFDKYKGKE